MTMASTAKLPGYLKPLNRIIVGLQRLGISVGTMRVLAIPGRSTGRLRATPVSPLTVAGHRYVIAGLGDEADWVRNARARGWGLLSRGRHQQRVRLVELPVEGRAAILRAFPREVPHGVGYFTAVHGVTADPEQFAALAPKCPVFRLEPLEPDTR